MGLEGCLGYKISMREVKRAYKVGQSRLGAVAQRIRRKRNGKTKWTG